MFARFRSAVGKENREADSGGGEGNERRQCVANDHEAPTECQTSHDTRPPRGLAERSSGDDDRAKGDDRPRSGQDKGGEQGSTQRRERNNGWIGRPIGHEEGGNAY